MEMQNQIVHKLDWTAALPERLNCPFYYQPDLVSLMAAKKVQEAVVSMAEWTDEIEAGKMFGVLVVIDENGSVTGENNALCYLQAYSGQIGGREDWTGWVPAVFDYLQPDGHFVKREAEISQINQKVSDMMKSDRHRMNCARLTATRERQVSEIEAYRKFMVEQKSNREIRRNAGESSDVLIKESQFQKAEFKRLKQRLEAEMIPLQKVVTDFEYEILRLKAQRKAMSDELQRWLFSQFVMINGRGERADLLQIFKDTPQVVPPSGAGECCAPKMLQYALLNGLKPISMSEFWWGKSPVGEMRNHLAFYPACQGKCKPILDFMLQGLDVEDNPLKAQEQTTKLNVVYEDEWIVAVDKPTGMLSVPGKGQRLSAQEILQRQLVENAYPVHRLDMQTSGILLFAKSETMQKKLQGLFSSRNVRKKYCAVLGGEYDGTWEGEINVPLSPDYENRPRQKVDVEHGKVALTHYIIKGVREGHTYVNLYPKTGRTHQLRVHCAYEGGLGIPIVGDDLYGLHDERLLLHAEKLDFVHPITHKEMHIECKCPF